MEQYKTTILLLISLICLPCISQEKIDDNSTVDSKHEEKRSYLKHRDFDGDGIMDKILFDFSGGAHCCYKMSLYISSLSKTITYPFEMDGGYLGGVDGSQPNQFEIKDYDQDGLPEIFMLISTYNGEKYPVEKRWTKKYGIKTNTILFDFFEENMLVKDYNK
ncbi:hypothetical protein [Flavivirga eckloniae]|nr:hypothetical protein [Flavivirga eckloniae]